MDSKKELADSLQLPEEGQLTPKVEPLDVDFIKRKDFEDNIFGEQGYIESTKVNKHSIKEEMLESNGSENFPSSIVRHYFFGFSEHFKS